jgi:hypothetical protein
MLAASIFGAIRAVSQKTVIFIIVAGRTAELT